QSINDINCAIADILEDDFNINWYTSTDFAESREKYKSIVSAETTPFKIELANYFNEMLQKDFLLPEELEKLKLITNNSIAGIITTNYDCLIEKYFSFTTYTSQEELLFSPTQEFCELYKIHGCASNPKSIVIDSEDYAKIASKRKYLASKLLTIFVEHPIIFIGYSINDEDILNILSDIVDCLNSEQLKILRSRMIFVDRCANSSLSDIKIEETNIVMRKKDVPMTKILLKDYGLLYEILSRNKSKYPVKILRALKQNIYELVTSNDPTDKLKIMLPIEQLDNFKDAEFVIGVGIAQVAELAYKTYSVEDIYLDIIFDDKNFNSDLLVEHTLGPHLSRTSGSMPIFKYLSKYSKETIPNHYNHYLSKLTNIDCLFNSSIRKDRKTSEGTSIKEIQKKHPFPRSMYYISRLPIQYIDAQELKDYLYSILINNQIVLYQKQPHSSDIRRLIKVYDWLMYHDEFQKNKPACNSVSSEQ
ncbi:MAG: SIR2 family protein, partial [Lachnospiraceae bacterium]|nr:SIR2 family protein [Lachnospiraceae bacterium]